MTNHTAMTVLDEIRPSMTTREAELAIDRLAVRADAFEKIKSWRFDDGSRIWRMSGIRTFHCCPPRETFDYGATLTN